MILQRGGHPGAVAVKLFACAAVGTSVAAPVLDPEGEMVKRPIRVVLRDESVHVALGEP